MMKNVTVLRKQVKKFVDTAWEKALKMVYHLFDASKEDDWWNEASEVKKEY